MRASQYLIARAHQKAEAEARTTWSSLRVKTLSWCWPSRWISIGLLGAAQACQASGHGGEPAPASAPAAVSQVPNSDGGAAVARHVLLVVQHDSAGFRIRHAQVVASALPQSRFPDALPWRADVEDSAGKSLASVTLPAGGELRGEFAGPDGGMQAVHFRKDDFAFAVRVPVLEQAAQIRFWQSGSSAAQAVELGVTPYATDVK